jgi:hypothetical protein
MVDLGLIEVEVRGDHLLRKAAYSLVEGDVGEDGAAEHLEEDEVFGSGVFDVVSGDDA